MATKNRQSQFYRSLSLVVPLLISAVAPALPGDIDPSRYTPFQGDRFYLLSETTFSSGEAAWVRLEAPNRRTELEAYSGADIRLYRIDDPLAFLGKQKNLHRPVMEGGYSGEGLRNALSYLWDSWYKKSRLAWQRILAYAVRGEAVRKYADLKQTPPHTYQTKFQNNPQFTHAAGLKLLDEFRYPIWTAAPLGPPAGVGLEGSSSNFITPKEGTVAVPLGKLAPGLYLVEAIIGTFRASSFVFVSDTVAVTKISGKQLFVWSVNKQTGKPAARTEIVLTDGVGILAKGAASSDGVFKYDGKSLDRTYVIGRDRSGGVFISENFYYDSEIYGVKLYMFTDRPLYRPGDTVMLKAVLRKFTGSSSSMDAAAAEGRLLVRDSSGSPFISKRVALAGGADGGQTSFVIPEGANPGGYTLELALGEDKYTGALRVANYTKPHFELDITFGRPAYRTREPIRGRILAAYPNGAPVAGAKLDVEVRKQRLTMVGDELQSADRFPVKVSQKDYVCDKTGLAEFELPAVDEPSRYILSVRAVDGSAFRVAATRELTVAVASEFVTLKTPRQYSAPGERVTFTLEAVEGGTVTAARSWEAVRLQDQSRTGGAIAAGQKDFAAAFERPGSYTITALDQDGVALGYASHWVQGAALADIPGSISIVPDKEEYEPGEWARALITFSTPVADALFTLERDEIERYSLLSRPAPWLKLKRLSDREWQVRLLADEAMNPNVTLSVAYVSGGRYSFENKGIRIAVPKLQIRISPDKGNYAPQEKAGVEITTTFKGKPVPASLSVSVVDEMIYVLQPELAPDISDFFHHPRRNQVRTSSSLSFYSFDSAVSLAGAPASGSGSHAERSLKLRERPRREDKDTAFWTPALKTDNNGHARFSFAMPDSVARWRITARGMTAAGDTGQKTGYINSVKDVYLKWSGPTMFRRGDAPEICVIAFNMGTAARPAVFKASGPGVKQDKNEVVSLKPGPNFLNVPMTVAGGGTVTVQLLHGRKQLDSLSVKVSALPEGWLAAGALSLKSGSSGNVLLPAGASNIRLSAAPNLAAGFLRAVDYLADYPYGCVEQVSSRLLPLSLAYSLIPAAGLPAQIRERLADRLAYERVRLIKMAGPNAVFSWWGNMAQSSAFLTAYAYYADKTATSVLNLELPAQHWEHVLDVYKDKAGELSPAQDALALWLMTDMGLPTRTMLEGAFDRLARGAAAPAESGGPAPHGESLIFMDDGRQAPSELPLAVLGLAAEKAGLPLTGISSAAVQNALNVLERSPQPLSQAVSLLGRRAKGLSAADSRLAEELLDGLLPEEPTIDRSLTLLFLYKALGWTADADAYRAGALDLGPGWMKISDPTGLPLWAYQGAAREAFKLPDALSKQVNLSAQLLFDFPGKEEARLPVTIKRRLYRLEQQDEALKFRAVPLGEDWQVNISDLYMDEIEVSPAQGRSFSFGLLEAALPPGAAVDETTWGMKVETGQGQVTIGAEGLQPGERSYSVALEKLEETVTVRHLLRFSQAGAFQIPPARYFRMYAPAEKSFEGGYETALRKIVVR